MIDVCLVIYKNYELLRLQMERWSMFKDFRWFVIDNTPLEFRQPIDPLPAPHKLFTHDVAGDDGETHGSALDFFIQQAESDIVGICDSDFFITHPDPWAYVYPYFQQGCKAVGVEPYSKGWMRRNLRLEEQTREDFLSHGQLLSHHAPCVFCCFYTREFARSETFVVTHIEGRLYRYETGWRHRAKMFRENIPNHVIRVFQYPNQHGIFCDTWYYGTPEEAFGVHLVAGSTQPGRAKWLPHLLVLPKNPNYLVENTVSNSG